MTGKLAAPARDEPGSDLFERMTDLRSLDAAWERVRANGGCAGGDGETVEGFRPRAAKRLIILSRLLRTGEYRPRDLRVVQVAKRSGGTRPLAIPSIEDRVAQTACAQTLTPVLDPTFADASFGYRPGRSVAMAVRAVGRLRSRGFTHVVEADIVRCFERIPQGPLLDRLENALAGWAGGSRVADLAAHWMEHAALALDTPGRGLAQGSPLSPLLANLYLDSIDDALEARHVRLVRFADDFVLLCRSEAAARRALDEAEAVLGAHGLELRGDRTRVVDFDRGFEFLGHLFVRSMTLKRIADPEEDAIELMRDQAALDRQEAETARASTTREKTELARGLDRGQRVLHVVERKRRLVLRGQSFAVLGEADRPLIAVAHGRVDRIELGPGADADSDAIRHALATGTELAFVNGHGETLGRLVRGSHDRAGLHLAQARTALDGAGAADLARRIVEGRMRNERAQLHRLNRGHADPEVVVATKTLGRMIRKLPRGEDVATLRGHEGAAAAVYWPALGRLAAEAPQPFRRSRPARDPLNATINYLTALLARDIRVALTRRGLHPGIGVLHIASDGSEACVWDLMEGFRAALSEGLAVALFNQGRLAAAMFERRADGDIRIGAEARRALVVGYETAAGRRLKSPHSKRSRTWRRIMEEEAGAYAAHCRDPDGKPFAPYIMRY